MRQRRRARRTRPQHASDSVGTPGHKARPTSSPSLAGAFSGRSPDREADLMAASDELRLAMERSAARLKELVLKQPPLDLLTYLWSQLQMGAMLKSDDAPAAGVLPNDGEADVHAALEYAHAIFSCFHRRPGEEEPLNESACVEILSLVEDLRHTALMHSLAASSRERTGPFGRATGDIEFSARSAWILIRGNRYQVLEQEFFEFVLAPHDDALRSAYGVGAADVATGLQAITTAMREGLNAALATVEQHMAATETLAKRNGLDTEQALRLIAEEHPEDAASLRDAMLDIFRAGLCNLSRQTTLPAALLQDLAYDRGQNGEFFGPGDFSGTPLRTLPARIRPLVALDDGYYATDAQFVRDATYRAIARGLTARLPEYREEWNRRQKRLSETAFEVILREQLDGGLVLTEVEYQDPTTLQWTEADAVIALDDVLIVIEAKAGVGAMASPATHFDHHVRAVNTLVVSAYQQAKRFLEYAASAETVPLFRTSASGREEVHRLSLRGYCRVFPIGLTVESFAPFSAMCKELPGLTPILGKHPFVSMSIDDLFVLSRFLPSAGELCHYLGVRQNVAGIRGAKLFDELDHLGAYIVKNRFDLTMRSQLTTADRVTWDGFSEVVDNHFSGDRWRTEPPPRQRFPDVLGGILECLGKARTPGWLAADSAIRDLDDSGRAALDRTLRGLVGSLPDRKVRWFATHGHDVATLFFWLYRHGDPLDRHGARRQAELSALASRQSRVRVVCAAFESAGLVTSAETLLVAVPDPGRTDYRDLALEAESLRRRSVAIPGVERRTAPKPLGRNSPCWCGSGAKLKKCHGR